MTLSPSNEDAQRESKNKRKEREKKCEKIEEHKETNI